MTRTLSIHEAAEVEINEAADYDDLENAGLGNIFVDEIQKAVGTILEFPEAAPLIQGRVIKKSLFKFPFSLIYSVRSIEIRLLAVAHHRRRPFYWRDRR